MTLVLLCEVVRKTWRAKQSTVLVSYFWNWAVCVEYGGWGLQIFSLLATTFRLATVLFRDGLSQRLQCRPLFFELVLDILIRPVGVEMSTLLANFYDRELGTVGTFFAVKTSLS